jgi:hypothetical protein
MQLLAGLLFIAIWRDEFNAGPPRVLRGVCRVAEDRLKTVPGIAKGETS